MHEKYDHLRVRAQRDTLLGLGAVLSDPPNTAGGTVIGAWLGAGSIGWFDDEAIVLLGSPDAKGGAAEWAASVLADADTEATSLRATERPSAMGRMRTNGIHAHRWFAVEPANVDEVVGLSVKAWPAFESNFDAHIEGLFENEDRSKLLLITWYASVAEWERSRGVGAAEGALGEARRSFQRRRQLTQRQVVQLAVPIAL